MLRPGKASGAHVGRVRGKSLPDHHVQLRITPHESRGDVANEAAEEVGLPTDAVQFVNTTDRTAVGNFLAMSQYIDLAIPRGYGAEYVVVDGLRSERAFDLPVVYSDDRFTVYRL